MAHDQHDAELWGCLLWFKADGTLSISLNLPSNMVCFTDAQGFTTKLKWVKPWDGIEMLGMQKAAMLQETAEWAFLNKKLGKFIKGISACLLRAHNVWISYTTIMISSITYSLSCALFTQKDFGRFHKRFCQSYYHFWDSNATSLEPLPLGPSLLARLDACTFCHPTK
eukprot:6105835-Ditylum_brightwellii.AAC.1